MRALQRTLLIAACVFAVLAVAAVVVILTLTSQPSLPANSSTMDPNGKLELWEQDNGTVRLSWPAGTNADGYLIEVLQKEKNHTLYTFYASGETSYILPELPQDQSVTIRINSVSVEQNGEEEGMRLGENALEVTGIFATPTISNLDWELNTQQRSVTFTYNLSNGGSCTLYRQEEDGGLTQMDKSTAEEKTVVFGTEGDCPIPTDDETVSFAMAATTEEKQYTFYGLPKHVLSIQRAHLLDGALLLNCRHEGQNIYTFTWNDVSADYYELQMLSAGNSGWTSLSKISGTQQRTFTTQNLIQHTTYQFRVVAYTGDTMTDEAFVSEPAKIQITTGAAAVYCTVWPQKDLEVYRDAKKNSVIGVAPGAQAYCVLAVENGLFKVRFGDGYGYLDSNYCMINLSEYLGDLCSYDITNCYNSVFTAHEYALPGVTGMTIPGYSNVYLEDGNYLVPLLYPVAQKLEKAAQAALKQNYRLKIYDAYRPAEATYMLYEKVSALADKTLPNYTYDGNKGTFSGMTYLQLITNSGQFKLTAFLAPGGSRHNQGLALDLTLEDVSTEKEVAMQSPMHDLSYFSTTWKNNKNAKILAQIMTDAGFATLTTEWWHFQDDIALETLKIDSYLWSGVTAQCWMWDGSGWLYRNADGSYCADRTVEIDGVTYTFDINGYVTE